MLTIAPKIRHWLERTLRWLLGGLFLWAGGLKLADPRAFARHIDQFGLIPGEWLVATALLLPLLEVIAGLLTLLRRRGGLPLMAILLLLFLSILWFGMLSGLDIDCGCFSLAESREHTSLRQAFARDWLMLAGLALLGALTRRHSAVKFPHQDV